MGVDLVLFDTDENMPLCNGVWKVGVSGTCQVNHTQAYPSAKLSETPSEACSAPQRTHQRDHCSNDRSLG